MNKIEKPLVSVIIPTYNRVKMLGNAINSALNQTYNNHELIIVDDGSTDGTEAFIKQNFPNLKYIKKENGGQASARNAGLEHTNGKYIASLDSDDCWHETFLEKLVEKLENDNFDFVFANWSQEQKDGNFIDYLLKQYIHLPEDHPKETNIWIELDYDNLRSIYIAGCPSPSTSLLIRADLLKKMGWNEEMSIGDDWCMLLDIIFNNKIKAAYTTEQLWKKHINANNIYDGRNRMEVLKLLHIKDKSAILDRYKHLMTPNEIGHMQNEYVTNLILISKESLRIHKNLKDFVVYFFKALANYPKLALKLMFKGGIRKIFFRNSDKKIVINK